MPRTIQVRVIPSAKKNEIRENPTGLKVYLTAPPLRGKANKMLVKFLSEHFKVKKSQITLVKGEKSRDKIIQIEE